MAIMQLLKRIAIDVRGATAIEYGLIASLVVIASMTAIGVVAQENTRIWDELVTKIVTAKSGVQ